jgi:hypothetical protein
VDDTFNVKDEPTVPLMKLRDGRSACRTEQDQHLKAILGYPPFDSWSDFKGPCHTTRQTTSSPVHAGKEWSKFLNNRIDAIEERLNSLRGALAENGTESGSNPSAAQPELQKDHYDRFGRSLNMVTVILYETLRVSKESGYRTRC